MSTESVLRPVETDEVSVLLDWSTSVVCDRVDRVTGLFRAGAEAKSFGQARVHFEEATELVQQAFLKANPDVPLVFGQVNIGKRTTTEGVREFHVRSFYVNYRDKMPYPDPADEAYIGQHFTHGPEVCVPLEACALSAKYVILRRLAIRCLPRHRWTGWWEYLDISDNMMTADDTHINCSPDQIGGLRVDDGCWPY